MTKIVRTRNVKLVEKILRSDPKLWSAAGGDDIDPISDLPLFPDDDNIYYLVCKDEQLGLLGLCIFHDMQNGTCRAHANFLSKHWGKNRDATEQAAKLCITWMFDHADIARVEATIPDEYLPVQLFADRIGLQCTDIEDDCKHYAAEREEWAP